MRLPRESHRRTEILVVVGNFRNRSHVCRGVRIPKWSGTGLVCDRQVMKQVDGLARNPCWASVDSRLRATRKRSTLKPKTGARETVTGLVKQGTVERVYPIQRNLLITRRNVYPRARGEPASGAGLNVLLEDIARTYPVFASDLQVYPAS